MRDPVLAAERTPVVGERPFYGDLLNRFALAQHLTNYMYSLRAGAVVAIDASWGEGKTWFGRNWAEYLKQESHKVIYIDAFEQDYIEDPFMLISAEILESMGQDELAPKLTETATNIVKTLLPLGTKIFINAIGHWMLGTSNLSDKSQAMLEDSVDISADTSSEWIRDRLTKHAGDKLLMQAFKEQLTQFASSDPNRPVVIFIDELDRCKPTFAVELIERIKHFFDVPNIVFVLLLNRDQLQKAVKGVYGAETDATMYLSKFVNFFFSLPKERPHTSNEFDRTMRYVNRVAKNYQFDIAGDRTKSFLDELGRVAFYFNLSLRDIERCIALFAFTDWRKNTATKFLVYVIVLKVTQPELLDKLVVNDMTAHQKAKKSIDEINSKLSNGSDRYLEALSEWHRGHIEGFESIHTIFKIFAQLEHTGISYERLFVVLSKQVDLEMS